MRFVRLFGCVIFAVGSLAGPIRAAELQPAAMQAWDSYNKRVDARLQVRVDGQKPFLWTDESADRRARVLRGEVVVAPVTGHGTYPVPNGLIHDWIGAAFIPNATIHSLFRVVHDYNRYKEFYKPVVADSKVLSCSSDKQEFFMLWQRRVLFLNAALQGHYRAYDVAAGPQRGYSIAETTQVREVENYGQTGERLLPPDKGNGLIWRLRSIARYAERDGGVYLELEAIALTRDIPASLHWLVSPIVTHLSINSLTTTLSETRDAVAALSPTAGEIALCPNAPGISPIARVGGAN
jgi:hypothetical protein